MPNPCTVTGNLQTLSGGKIAQGKVTFQLGNTGFGTIPRVIGTGEFPGLKYVVMTDQTGAFSTPLWGNDNIDPANTIYFVTFADYLGNEVGPIQYSITGPAVNLNTAAAQNTVLPPLLTIAGVPILFAGVPTGTCIATSTAVNTLTGDYYDCLAGAWLKVGPGTVGALSSPIVAPNPLAFDVGLNFKGPVPWIDVTRYGVRSTATGVAPMVPGITCTINSTSNSATLSAASTFQNGDGVTIYGAGAACTLTTPTGVTVTPSVAAAGTGTGLVVNSPSGGATTYNYQVIVRNKAGCFTAASTVATTTTGAASLGAQNVTVSGLTRSGTTVTATTSAPHGLSVGSQVGLLGANSTDNLNFGGYYVVATVPDNTHFTYATGQDAASGAATSSVTSMTAYWFNCNHVSWTPVTGAYEYYIYGRTGGSLTLLGVSKAQSPGAQYPNIDPTWDDFGSPMMDGILLPFFVPNTPPGASLPNPLVTTITSGAGTTTLILGLAATTSVVGGTILFDNTPNIQTAAAQAQSNSILYFPQGTYVTNSYLTIPGSVSIHLAGATLFLNDTMETHSGDKIFGMLEAQGASSLSFGWPIGGTIVVNRAFPGVFGESGSDLYFHGIQFTSQGNAGVALHVEGASNSHFQFLNFSGGGSSYMDFGMILRGTDFLVNFDHVAFIMGPSQTIGASYTPALYLNVGSVALKHISLNRRGIFFIPAPAGANVTFEATSRMQGGIMPFFTVYNTGGNVGGAYSFTDAELDTTSQPLFENLSGIGASNSGGVYLSGAAGSAPSSGLGYMSGKPMGVLTPMNNSNQGSITQMGQTVAVNTRILSGITFANLGTPPNGPPMIYCPDCTAGSNPCTGGGTGAYAKRLGGVWVCT